MAEFKTVQLVRDNARDLPIVRQHGIGFFPVVNWVERGEFRPGNSLPRFHIVWGTGQGLVGSGIGLLSGLVGAGGAFLSVPFMTWCNVPIRQAVGTSAALGFPIALANTVGYLVAGRSMAAPLPGAVGYLYLPALAVIAVASMTMAPVGARVAHRTDVARLKKVFALLLFGLAASMAYKSQTM